jgi:hypothetical protein
VSLKVKPVPGKITLRSALDSLLAASGLHAAGKPDDASAPAETAPQETAPQETASAEAASEEHEEGGQARSA